MSIVSQRASHGDDVLSKDLIFKDGEDLALKLKPRRDLSTPFAANYGLVLNIYEQENTLGFKPVGMTVCGVSPTLSS